MIKIFAVASLFVFTLFTQSAHALTFSNNTSGAFDISADTSVEFQSDGTDEMNDDVNSALNGLANSCQIDGERLYSGQTRRFYKNKVGDCSDYIDRTCNKAVLSGDSSYQYLSCTEGDSSGVAAQANERINEQMRGRCADSTGRTILYNGESAIFYKNDAGNCSEYQRRTCRDGKLTGSDEYKYRECADVQEIIQNKNKLNNSDLNKAGKAMDNVVDNALHSQDEQINKQLEQIGGTSKDLFPNKSKLDNSDVNKVGKRVDTMVDSTLRRQGEQLSNQLGDLWNSNSGSGSNKGSSSSTASSHGNARAGFDASAKVGGKSVSVHVAGSADGKGVSASVGANTGGRAGTQGSIGAKAAAEGKHKTGVKMDMQVNASTTKSGRYQAKNNGQRDSKRNRSYINFGDSKVYFGSDVQIRVEGDTINVENPGENQAGNDADEFVQNEAAAEFESGDEMAGTK